MNFRNSGFYHFRTTAALLFGCTSTLYAQVQIVKKCLLLLHYLLLRILRAECIVV